MVGGRTLERAPAAAVKVSSNEQAPNNTVLQANLAEMGRNFAAAIDPENDVDDFKFTAIRRTGGASWQCISKSSLQHCALLSAWIKRTNPICLAGKDPARKGADVGFQLWDVAKRRGPPVPPTQDDKN